MTAVEYFWIAYALAFVFAVLCFLFGILGFAATATWVGAKVLFALFLVLFLVSLASGAMRPAGPPI